MVPVDTADSPNWFVLQLEMTAWSESTYPYMLHTHANCEVDLREA